MAWQILAGIGIVALPVIWERHWSADGASIFQNLDAKSESRRDSERKAKMEISTEIRDAIVECASTLGFCHGCLGVQPNFAQFDGLEGRLRQSCMEKYLAEYREALEVHAPNLAESA